MFYFLSYPFLWMLLSSFKTNREIYNPGNLLPDSFDPFAYRLLFSGDFIDFYDVLFRSILLCGGQAILSCLVSTAVGFALAKGRFRGKIILSGVSLLIILYLILSAMSLSLFEWMASMDMTGSFYGLLATGVASGLGVIFFTQVFRKVPDELIDLARVEGGASLHSFLCFLLLVKPALITYFILHFFSAGRIIYFPSLSWDRINLLYPWLWLN